VHPDNLIWGAYKNGLLNNKEMQSQKIKKAAKEAAEDVSIRWPKGAGFGSSDKTFAIKNMLDISGFKTDFQKGLLIRKDIEGGRYINESIIEATEQTAQTMEQDITKIIKKYFPKSYIAVYFSKSLLPHITIVFAIGQKSDWSNGIFENDPMSTKMMITYGFNDDGTLSGEPMEFESIMGKLYLKSTNKMYAYDSIKLGVRKKKGDYNSILKAVDSSFAKMKQLVKSNLDKLDDRHLWVKKYV